MVCAELVEDFLIYLFIMIRIEWDLGLPIFYDASQIRVGFTIFFLITSNEFVLSLLIFWDAYRVRIGFTVFYVMSRVRIRFIICYDAGWVRVGSTILFLQGESSITLSFLFYTKGNNISKENNCIYFTVMLHNKRKTPKTDIRDTIWIFFSS